MMPAPSPETQSDEQPPRCSFASHAAVAAMKVGDRCVVSVVRDVNGAFGDL